MTVHLSRPVDDRDHARGPEDARVTLVEYGDFQCPYCGLAYPIVKALEKLVGNELRVVFRNFPLRDVHAQAEAAAQAAEAAGAQGAFWEMHDLLFENQADLTAPALLRYASHVVADATRWARDVRRRTFMIRVEEDFVSGVMSGVRGTPAFYVNGRRHDGAFDLDSLARAVERELRIVA